MNILDDSRISLFLIILIGSIIVSKISSFNVIYIILTTFTVNFICIFMNFNHLFDLRFSIILGFVILILVFLKRYLNGPATDLKTDLTGKIVIVTGANAGIGLETSKLLLKRGAVVVFACRDEARTLSSIKMSIKSSEECKRAVYMKLDLASFISIKSFAEKFKERFQRLDILVNNAGGMFDKQGATEDGFETTLGVNYLGGLFLTLMLLKKMSQKGRIINVGSGLFLRAKLNFEVINNDFNFERLNSTYNFKDKYALSKLGQFFFTKYISGEEVQKRFGWPEFKSIILHPGVIITDAQGKLTSWYIQLLYRTFYPHLLFFTKTIFYGAQTTLHTCLLDYDLLRNSGFYSDCKEALLPKVAEKNENMINFLKYTKSIITHHIKSDLPVEITEFLDSC